MHPYLNATTKDVMHRRVLYLVVTGALFLALSLYVGTARACIRRSRIEPVVVPKRKCFLTGALFLFPRRIKALFTSRASLIPNKELSAEPEWLSAPARSDVPGPCGSLELRADGAYRRCARRSRANCSLFWSCRFSRDCSVRRLVASEVVSRPSESETLLLRHPLASSRLTHGNGRHRCGGLQAELTLDLCLELLQEGWILKDATPL